MPPTLAPRCLRVSNKNGARAEAQGFRKDTSGLMKKDDRTPRQTGQSWTAVTASAASKQDTGLLLLGGVHAEALASHSRPWSLSITVPPLATVLFVHTGKS